jgi:hypothetical protein
MVTQMSGNLRPFALRTNRFQTVDSIGICCRLHHVVSSYPIAGRLPAAVFCASIVASVLPEFSP